MDRAASYAGFWFAGLTWGLRALLRARTFAEAQSALRYILSPVDLWRYVEFHALLDAWNSNGRTLDVGSPKLATLLAPRHNSKLRCATDITFHPLMELKTYLHKSSYLKAVQCDGCALPFPSESFSFVFSISALEHIGDNGDTRCMRDIARVLSPGAQLFLTVPLLPNYHELWVNADPYGHQSTDKDGRVFFSRYYNTESLNARLIAPSGLKIVWMRAWQESTAGWYARYVQRTSNPRSLQSILIKSLDWYWAWTRLELLDDPPAGLTKHGVVALLLEKSRDDGQTSGCRGEV